MRSTYEAATVRLYHLDGDAEGGMANTLFYGPLSQALSIAATQSDTMREGLFIATDNDVIAYMDLIEEDDRD